jgi:hypothetical protein
VNAYDSLGTGQAFATDGMHRRSRGRGVLGPGVNIISLGARRESGHVWRNECRCTFVTGGVALLWFEFPIAPATEPRGNDTTAVGRVVGLTSSCSAEDIPQTLN